MTEEQAREAAIAEWKDRHNCPELGLTMHDGAIMVFGEGFDAAWDAALEYANRWTYLPELPSESGYYLVMVNGVVWMGFCAATDRGTKIWIDVNPDNQEGFDVDAWRPLPKAAEIKRSEDEV